MEDDKSSSSSEDSSSTSYSHEGHTDDDELDSEGLLTRWERKTMSSKEQRREREKLAKEKDVHTKAVQALIADDEDRYGIAAKNRAVTGVSPSGTCFICRETMMPYSSSWSCHDCGIKWEFCRYHKGHLYTMVGHGLCIFCSRNISDRIYQRTFPDRPLKKLADDFHGEFQLREAADMPLKRTKVEQPKSE